MSQLFKVAFGGRRKKSRARLLQAMPAPSSTVVEGTGVGGVGGGGEGGKPSSSGSSGRGAAAAQQQDRNGDSLEEAYPQRKSYQSSRGGGVGGKRRRRTTSEDSSQSASSGRSSRRAAHPNGDGLSSDGDGGGGGGDDDDDYDDDEGGFDSEIDGEYTIKDRQDVLNLSHPFGVRLWKPALYKKDRSINRLTIAALHASPTDSAELYLSPGNVFYAAVFGWWLSLVTFVIAAVLAVVPTQDGRKYASTLRGLAGYIFWPFGKYVETAVSAEEALEAGTSTHGVDDVREPLLGLATGVGHAGRDRRHARLTFAGCLYYLFFYGLLAPLYLFVSACCWFMVFTLPMAKLTATLMSYMHESPMSLQFKSGSGTASQGSAVLLCTYQAVSWKCYKYTIDGTNILFINLIGVVFFVLVDNYFLKEWWGSDTFITNYITIFVLCLASTIPLAYFIGQGVAAISAQSSLGMGAVINATFGSIVEVILYCMALKEGKGVLVQGSIVGSFMGSLLLMPGLSMVAGGIKVKQQLFNAKSAGVTSTMLIFSLIGVCTPTLFYNTYGPFQIKCSGCPPTPSLVAGSRELCSRCSYEHINLLTDDFFQKKVKLLAYLCALLLPLAYLIGLWFTLRTHASHIYSDPPTTHPSGSHHGHNGRLDSQYRRLTHSHRGVPNSKSATPPTLTLNAVGAAPAPPAGGANAAPGPSAAPPLSSYAGGSGADQNAAAGTSIELPAPDKCAEPRAPFSAIFSALNPPESGRAHSFFDSADGGEAGGHDAPNWSKLKSSFVLCTCTVLFSAIAEILVDSVDPVVENMNIDEKFLGLTLFALVPNVTEFMNAISFAIYNNIALSMEIGSAYAVQVALLQIPALVAYSGFTHTDTTDLYHMFTLIFDRWDIITLVFAVFLLTYVYIEGKSNYFKGSMLVSAYSVLIISFFFVPPAYQHGDRGSRGH